MGLAPGSYWVGAVRPDAAACIARKIKALPSRRPADSSVVGNCSESQLTPTGQAQGENRGYANFAVPPLGEISFARIIIARCTSLKVPVNVARRGWSALAWNVKPAIKAAVAWSATLYGSVSLNVS